MRCFRMTDATTDASTKPSAHTDGAFSEGPTDMSKLTRYVDHVTYIVHGEERPTLKVTFHGAKLKNFPDGSMPEHVRRIVSDFSLLEFSKCSLTMLDTSLMSTFIEQWHPQ